MIQYRGEQKDPHGATVSCSGSLAVVPALVVRLHAASWAAGHPFGSTPGRPGPAIEGLWGGSKSGRGRSVKAPLITSSRRVLLPWLGFSRKGVLGRIYVRPGQRGILLVRPLVAPDRL